MHLSAIFKHSFNAPILLSILSIVFSTAIVIVYSSFIYANNIKQYIIQFDQKRTAPLIETVQQIVFQKIQKPFTALTTLKDYYIDIEKEMSVFQLTDLTLIHDYLNTEKGSLRLTNILDLNTKYSEFIKDKDKDEYYDRAVWFINNSKSELDFSDIEVKRDKNTLATLQLYIFSKMIPIFRSFNELNKESKNHGIELFFITNRKSEMIFIYSVYDDNPGYFQQFQSMTNSKKCRTKENKNPDYYYYPCRDWFIQIVNKGINTGLRQAKDTFFFITHPYTFVNFEARQSGISQCVVFRDPLIDKIYFQSEMDQPNDDDIVICIDLLYTNLLQAFDYFNRNLNGYFFIIPQGGNIPLYYPIVTRDDYNNDITRLEFPLSSEKDNSSQVVFFKNSIVPKLISEYTVRDIVANSSLKNIYEAQISFNSSVRKNNTSEYTYYKGESIYHFDIFPLFFYYKNTPEHLLSLIYVYYPTSILKERIVLFCCVVGALFFIIMMFVIAFSSQLIAIVRNGITNPIREVIRKIKMNFGRSEASTSAQTSKIAAEPNDESKDTEETEEDKFLAEGEIEDAVYNQEIVKQFELILSLKSVFLFLENPSAARNTHNLVDFLSSKETFSEVKNKKGSILCLSNIGQIASLSKKYDKAISFLIQVINEDSAVKTYIYSRHDGTSNEIENNQSFIEKEIIPQDKSMRYNPLIEKASNNCFLHFMKLFYAYKSFFSNLKALNLLLEKLKSKNQSASMNSSTNDKLIYELDLYISKEKHTPEKYVSFINQCIELSDDPHTKPFVNLQKTCYCLLELFECAIRQKRIQEKLLNKPKAKSAKDNKEDCLSQMPQLNDRLLDIKQISKRLIEKLNQMYSLILNQGVKRYLEYFNEFKGCKDKSDNSLSMKIIQLTPDLLFQRYYYLMGKVMKIYGNYSIAMRYYRRSITQCKLIFNKEMQLKANEKIAFILSYTLNKENNSFLSFASNEDRKVALKMNEEYIQRRNTAKEKDIIIVVDTSINRVNDLTNELMISTAKDLLRKYIYHNDRFGLFSFDITVNKLIGLSDHSKEDMSFIISMFDYLLVQRKKEKDSLKDDEDDEELSSRQMKYGLEAILEAYRELAKKKTEEREQWIIVLSECFQSHHNRNVSEENVMDLTKEWKQLNTSKNKPHLVLIGSVMYNKDKLNFIAGLLDNTFIRKADYVEYDNLVEI